LNINTIIFDLGGVIIDLDEKATTRAFMELSGHTLEQIIHHYHTSPYFKNHEKGLITDTVFRQGIREVLDIKATDNELDQAWNAMLGNIPIERLDLLLKLRKKFKVLILSNTNGIHEPAFTQILKEVSGKNGLTDFADEVYYSHILKMRKPDPEIYLTVLQLSNLQAESTLFLDDKIENLKGAESVGIQTMHIAHPDKIFELEKYV